jgi:hypothetical protein
VGPGSLLKKLFSFTVRRPVIPPSQELDESKCCRSVGLNVIFCKALYGAVGQLPHHGSTLLISYIREEGNVYVRC